MPIQFTENPQRSRSISFASASRAVAITPGLREATQAEAEAGAVLGKYMSPLRTDQFIDAYFAAFGNWKTTYINGTGIHTALSLGASGTVLASNGVSAAPSWQDPSTLISHVGFSAYLAASTSNDKTGDGTLYTLTGWTEIYDTNSAFNGTTFTAPVTGKYMVSAEVLLRNVNAFHNKAFMRITTSNRNYDLQSANAGAIRNSDNNCSLQAIAIVDMDAGDTCDIRIFVSGSTKTVGVYGQPSPVSIFQIALMR